MSVPVRDAVHMHGWGRVFSLPGIGGYRHYTELQVSRCGPDLQVFAYDVNILVGHLDVPAAYADLLALSLLRQQVPHLLDREGMKPDTPWQVLADWLMDKNTPAAVREATLLQLAFGALDD